FQRNAEGELVTAGGYRIQPSIVIPEGAQSITIGTDGTVSVRLPGQASPAQVGTLETVDFINAGGLQPIGENLYVETASSGTPQTGTPGLDGFGSLIQGSLEGSNVNVVSELVNMIETQRAYEMNSKAISTNDQMMQYLNNNL
ncbi:MAG: flagellar hook-basal body complex protein, partial [Woeseia sp.]